MIKKAIVNYINARAEKLRPCKHDWEFIELISVNETYPTEKYHKWIYRCKKCGKQNTLTSRFIN